MDDDVLPLSEPITDADGNIHDSLYIPKNTKIRLSIGALNMLESFWGPDSHTFRPSRWLNDEVSKERAQELAGHRHIMTFIDGPRACLGKLFALTEFKVRGLPITSGPKAHRTYS
jgi:cytochrome P450